MPKKRYLSEEHRSKISESNKGRTFSAEHREQLRKASWRDPIRRGHAKRLVQAAGLPLWRFLVDRARELADQGTDRDIIITELQRKWQRTPRLANAMPRLADAMPKITAQAA